MTTAVALFTRDLRVHDNAVLTSAVQASERVVPLFVLDDRIERTGFGNPGRTAFLGECLADLDRSLRERGGRLVVRRGEPVAEVSRVAEEVGAARVHLARDVSAHARAREEALRSSLRGDRRELVLHDEVHTVVAPGRLTPKGRDHFAVFTPYLRRWREARWRRLVPAPASIRVPDLDPGTLPGPGRRPAGGEGGEAAARRRADGWLTAGIHGYERHQQLLAEERTSRLSPYLHLGCVSALELARRAGRSTDAVAFVRQLAWRDFHHQVLAARPDASHRDYRSRGDRWRDDPGALDAWGEGHTGIPIVDAGMRQLRAEGWMHNRARLVTASFLTKTLGLDWREGAAHYFRWLVDGDVANNCLNWQWVAGTGTDTRPNRVLNPLRQAERYDPRGDYVRRHVPELAGLEGVRAHRPWRLEDGARRRLGYPPPIVDLLPGLGPVPDGR